MHSSEWRCIFVFKKTWMCDDRNKIDCLASVCVLHIDAILNIIIIITLTILLWICVQKGQPNLRTPAPAVQCFCSKLWIDTLLFGKYRYIEKCRYFMMGFSSILKVKRGFEVDFFKDCVLVLHAWPYIISGIKYKIFSDLHPEKNTSIRMARGSKADVAQNLMWINACTEMPSQWTHVLLGHQQFICMMSCRSKSNRKRKWKVGICTCSNFWWPN